MKKIIYFLLILFVSCSTLKKGQVKMTKLPRLEKFTNKDILKYGDEFAKMDWTKFNKKDTIIVTKYDPTIFGN